MVELISCPHCCLTEEERAKWTEEIMKSAKRRTMKSTVRVPTKCPHCKGSMIVDVDS